MMKQRAPQGSDHIELLAGEPRSTALDIAGQYAPERGARYTVQFKGNAHLDQLPDSNVLEIEIP